MLNILILWFVFTVFYTCKVRFDCDTNREARVNALRTSTFDKWVVFMCLIKAIWLVKRNSFQDKKRYMPLLIIYPMGWNLTVFAYRTHSFSGDAWLVKNILRDACDWNPPLPPSQKKKLTLEDKGTYGTE